MTDDRLVGLIPRSPLAVLEDLAHRAARAVAAGRGRPEVALYLASGPVVTGRLVAVGDERGASLVVLHVGGDVHAPRLVTVRGDQIVGVSHELAAPIVDTGPAPGRLELARAAASAAVDAGVAIAVTDGLPDAGRRAVGLVLPRLGPLLAALRIDALGREALAAITTVKVGAAATGEVRRDGADLVIVVPDDPDAPWDDHALTTALERAL